MGRFINGLLLGAGIGLLIAPMRGEEMRRMLGERFQELQGYLPENGQLNQYAQQVSGQVSQASSNLKGYAQQAASKMKDTGSVLGGLAQQSAGEVRQTGQAVVDATKQTVGAAKPGMPPTTAPFPSAYPEYVNPETKKNY